MLIWADKSEVNVRVINAIEKLYNKRRELNGLKDILKGWELSVIYRQIKIHFGRRKNISILDFGAGACPFGAYLNHCGYQDVTCLDKEKGWHRKMNDRSYNKSYDSHVKYIKKDITLGYNGEHDVIFSASVLEHLGKRERVGIIKILSRHLKSGGLFIHVVDFPARVDFKRLIDKSKLSISYNPEETPGCEEFIGAPRYTWWTIHKNMQMITRIAFFNEKED